MEDFIVQQRDGRGFLSKCGAVCGADESQTSILPIWWFALAAQIEGFAKGKHAQPNDKKSRTQMTK